MHMRELRQLGSDALRAKAEELSLEIAGRRYGRFQQKEKNVKKLKMLRHDLARVLTLLTEQRKNSSSAVPV